MELDQVRFDPAGLVPAIAQDADTGKVLMLAYMNREALEQTLLSGYATYYSRSRQKLWKKGETSGHVQKVVSLCYDCDGDTLLLKVEQTGPACHTGEESCFFHALYGEEKAADAGILAELMAVIQERRIHPKEGSYTNYLQQKGLSKIAKKVGEEATEVVVAAIEHNEEEIVYESADLLYHLLVLLEERSIPLSALWQELAQRR